MASPCEVLVDTVDRELAAQLIQLTADEAQRIEHKFSRYRDGNIVHQINESRGTPLTVDEETGKLLDFAQLCYQLSNGLFDITSGVLREIWRFDGSDRIPSRKQAKALLPRIGWEKATWQALTLTLPSDMEVDFGGIGKEYAVDSAAAKIQANYQLPFLINFGGDLYANRPPTGQTAWQVGIESLGGRSATSNIALQSGGIATSGDARRFLLKDGKRYSHILNPRTGWPISQAAHSITVAADSCLQAGMLSTIAMLQGKGAKSFLQAQQVLSWIDDSR